MKKVKLTSIQSESWEHPLDRTALKNLKKVPGLGSAVRTLVGVTTERSLYLVHLASAVKVSKEQFSYVYEAMEEVKSTLDYPEEVEIFIAENPFLNAGAVGAKKPFIVLNSSMLEFLDNEELKFVLGHELGHIMSGHVMYKTLLQMLIKGVQFLTQIPLSGIALMGLIEALKEWDRKSELSADRAALLSIQNPEMGMKILMKMAGGRKVSEMSLPSFMEQAREYQQSGSMLDQVYKVLNMMGQSHPFAVIRLSELMQWVQGGTYEQILGGAYERRKSNDFTEKAEKEYEETTQKSAESAQSVEPEDYFKQVREQMDRMEKTAKDTFSKFFKS